MSGFKKYLIGKLRNLTIWLNEKHAEANVLFFKSDNGKWIYLVMIGAHCQDAEKFYQIFPDTKEVTQTQFNKLYDKGIEIVVVGDKQDVDQMNQTDVEPEVLKVT